MIINKINQLLNNSKFSSNEKKEIIEIFKRISYNESEENLLRLLGIVTGRVFIGPAYFHLDISNSCNMNCSYCWFHSKTAPDKEYSDGWKKQQIKLSVFKKLVDDLHELKTELILFSGAGEPLIHPNIVEMVNYVKKKGMILQLFTNALLLDKNYAKKLVDANLDEIYCSISAANSNTYKKLHPSAGKNEFKTIEKNIMFLSKYKKEQNKTMPKVVLIEVINSLNYREALEMLNWVKKVGANTIRFQLMHNMKLKNVMLNQKEKEEFKKNLDKVKNLAKKYNIKIQENINVQIETFDSKSGDWEIDFYKQKGCFAGWYFSRYWVSDGISFCCVHKIVGSLKNKRFKDIWNSNKYNKMRIIAREGNIKRNTKMVNGNNLLDEECNHCGNYDLNRAAYEKLKTYGLLKFIK